MKNAVYNAPYQRKGESLPTYQLRTSVRTGGFSGGGVGLAKRVPPFT